jgi:hypothetical protein
VKSIPKHLFKRMMIIYPTKGSRARAQALMTRNKKAKQGRNTPKSYRNNTEFLPSVLVYYDKPTINEITTKRLSSFFGVAFLFSIVSYYCLEAGTLYIFFHLHIAISPPQINEKITLSMYDLLLPLLYLLQQSVMIPRIFLF